MYSRRGFLGMSSAALAAAGILSAPDSEGQEQKQYPTRDDRSASAPGPGQSSDRRPKSRLFLTTANRRRRRTNLQVSFRDSHTNGCKKADGRAKSQFANSLSSKSIAGVDMRLTAGGIRELHWHTAAEWAYMLYGNARITAH